MCRFYKCPKKCIFSFIAGHTLSALIHQRNHSIPLQPNRIELNHSKKHSFASSCNRERALAPIYVYIATRWWWKPQYKLKIPAHSTQWFFLNFKCRCLCIYCSIQDVQNVIVSVSVFNFYFLSLSLFLFHFIIITSIEIHSRLCIAVRARLQ